MARFSHLKNHLIHFTLEVIDSLPRVVAITRAPCLISPFLCRSIGHIPPFVPEVVHHAPPVRPVQVSVEFLLKSQHGRRDDVSQTSTCIIDSIAVLQHTDAVAHLAALVVTRHPQWCTVGCGHHIEPLHRKASTRSFPSAGLVNRNKPEESVGRKGATPICRGHDGRMRALVVLQRGFKRHDVGLPVLVPCPSSINQAWPEPSARETSRFAETRNESRRGQPKESAAQKQPQHHNFSECAQATSSGWAHRTSSEPKARWAAHVLSGCSSSSQHVSASVREFFPVRCQ
eukprot:4176223-Prymnesium_polylepis.1